MTFRKILIAYTGRFIRNSVLNYGIVAVKQVKMSSVTNLTCKHTFVLLFYFYHKQDIIVQLR